MANQRRYTIRCLLQTKHDTHKLLTVFNVLPNLISLLLAACEGTTVLYTTGIHTNIDVISRCPFSWCQIVVSFQFHAPVALSPVPIKQQALAATYPIVRYALVGNRTKTAPFYNLQPGHYTHYANTATVISKFVVRVSGSYNRKRFAWNCIHFSIILIPRLQLLISNLCESERQADRL